MAARSSGRRRCCTCRIQTSSCSASPSPPPLPPPPPPGDTAPQPVVPADTPPTPYARPAGVTRSYVTTVVGVAALAAVGIVFAARGGGDGGDAGADHGRRDPADGPASATPPVSSRCRCSNLTATCTSIPVDPADGSDGTASDRPGAHDTEPDWDPETNRLAFRRAEPSSNCTGLCYVVPGREGDAGKQVAQLVEPSGSSIGHAPAGPQEATLFYARTVGCEPGPGCAEELRVAMFAASDDGTGFADQLSPTTDVVVETGLTDVRDLDADPQEADRLVLADGAGVAIVDTAGVRRLPTSSDVSAVTYTADGNRIVAIGCPSRTAPRRSRCGTAPVGRWAPSPSATFAAAFARGRRRSARSQTPAAVQGAVGHPGAGGRHRHGAARRPRRRPHAGAGARRGVRAGRGRHQVGIGVPDRRAGPG